MADDTTETDQIERELAETRERMDRRLDELGDRLSPNQLVNDALAHVSGGGGADFTETLIAKAKANPIPAVIAGVGIAWLIASNSDRPRGKPDLPTRLRAAEAGVTRLDDEHPDVHASRLDDARGQVLGIARSALDTAASYAQRIQAALTSAGGSVRAAGHDLRDGAAELHGQAGRIDARSLIRDPVAQGAVAAAVGLVAGMVLPISIREERALGGFGDQLRSTGHDAAQALVDRGAQVAEDAIGAAQDSARAQGLTLDKPVGELIGDLTRGDLFDQVKGVAQEAAQAGRDSLRSPDAGDGRS